MQGGTAIRIANTLLLIRLRNSNRSWKLLLSIRTSVFKIIKIFSYKGIFFAENVKLLFWMKFLWIRKLFWFMRQNFEGKRNWLKNLCYTIQWKLKINLRYICFVSKKTWLISQTRSNCKTSKVTIIQKDSTEASVHKEKSCMTK